MNEYQSLRALLVADQKRWPTADMQSDKTTTAELLVSTMRRTSVDIGLENNGPDYPPTLLCPRCGGNYLHHSGVTIFDRKEDATTLTETKVENGVTTSRMVPTAESGNPSSRRDGLAIRFWCELCNVVDLELTVEQHKGCTYLGWRYGVPIEPNA